MRFPTVGLLLILSFFTLPVFAQVMIEQGFVRGMPPGHPVTAAFMTLVNPGEEPVVVDGGQSSVAATVEFHAHVHRDGKMSMQQVPSITIPAKGEFVLQPGEFHVMLIGLKQTLREGESVSLTLFSGNTPVVSAELPVRSVLNEHQHHH